jgi:alkylation response protein AidB-like acyl-CoA dehydrogenase
MSLELTLPEEERMIVETVRDFAEKELRPIARELDEEGRIPIGLVRKMQDLGLFGLMISEEYGGVGVSTACYVRVVEEISRVCAALAITLSVHNSVGAFPIQRFGTGEQRRKYLPLLASKWIGAFALTEAEAGSDAARLRLRAERVEAAGRTDYVLGGTKAFVTNGSIADLYLVMARTAEVPEAPHRGVTAFLVERTTPGMAPGKLEHKMGIRASDTTELVFESCTVPDTQRLGGEGEGFKIAMQSLDNGRIGVGAQAVGIAQGALEEALRYAAERRQFGRALRDFEGIQFYLADMKTQLDAARMLVYSAASLKDRGLAHTREAAMAKLFASQMATRVTHTALQIHGGYGYIKEYAVERYYRDARITEIYEGTSEMQKLVIARSLLGKR